VRINSINLKLKGLKTKINVNIFKVKFLEKHDIKSREKVGVINILITK